MEDSARKAALVSPMKRFTKPQGPWARYGAAVLASLAAFLVTDLFYPLFHGPVFLLPLVAVMISALYGGGGPGLLATFLSGVAFVYYFLPLTLRPAAHSVADLVRLGLFLFFSFFVSWVSASFRAAYRRAESARAEAEEANRFKSRLVSNVSHDLRTPLNAILGYIHLLLDETYGPIVEDQKGPLEGIRRNADHLLKMVNDILDLAKMESGRMYVESTRIEIAPLVEEILTEVKPLVDQKRLSIRCRIDRTLPPVELDRIKIKQILANLLSNAVKFTDQGGIAIDAADRPERGGIEIAVSDTGVGIPPEALPRIFETFYQVEETERPGGSGLGLAIVREMVDLIGGEITVQSEHGKGSTFTVFFPYRRSG